jgi:hypothetical protein
VLQRLFFNRLLLCGREDSNSMGFIPEGMSQVCKNSLQAKREKVAVQDELPSVVSLIQRLARSVCSPPDSHSRIKSGRASSSLLCLWGCAGLKQMDKIREVWRGYVRYGPELEAST